MWSLTGIVLALAVAAAAWRYSRAPGGFYAEETYGMDARAHRRYLAVSAVFAIYFAVTYGVHYETGGVAGLAVYALIAVFYAASFLRGASDE